MGVLTTAELIVTAVGTLGTGAVGTGVHWFAKKVIDNSDVSKEILSEIRSIKQSLYGSPDAKTPEGLSAVVTETKETVKKMGEQVEQIDTRLSLVERGCQFQHGEAFFREPRTNE